MLFGPLVAPGDRVALWLPNSFSWLACFPRRQFARRRAGAGQHAPDRRRSRGDPADAGARVLVMAPAIAAATIWTKRATLLARWSTAIRLGAADAPGFEWHASGWRGAHAGEPLAGWRVLYPVHLWHDRHAERRDADQPRLSPRRDVRGALPAPHPGQPLHERGAVLSLQRQHARGTVCLVAGARSLRCRRGTRSVSCGETERQAATYRHMDLLPRRRWRSVPRRRASPLATLKVANDIEHAGIPCAAARRTRHRRDRKHLRHDRDGRKPDDVVSARSVGEAPHGNGRPQAGNACASSIPRPARARPAGSRARSRCRGPTITPGYYNRPEANAAAFTDDGWLRSGDARHADADGELRYIARLKESSASAARISRRPRSSRRCASETGVQQVCVLGVPDERLDEVAAAVVVGRRRRGLAAVLAQVRGRARRIQDAAMQVYAADALPMTATNRVQRAVLREWIGQSRLDARRVKPGRSDEERYQRRRPRPPRGRFRRRGSPPSSAATAC